MIVVTGASGSLGRPLLPLLGPDVHALSRSARTGQGVTWHVADLATGGGAEVLKQADTVIHLASDPRKKTDVAQTRTLLAHTRPDAHLVYISIVGVDDHPYGYYQVKLEVERLIEARPHTILRTTQFHGFVAMFFAFMAKGPLLLVPSGTSGQPVAVEEVAARLAALALDKPAGRVPDLGGPEVLDVRSMARSYLRAVGKRRPILPIRLPGKAAAAFREGKHLAATTTPGQTWAQYLETL
jgi:uncharacterized protein YbjT (DUF2867 family)